MIWFWDLIAKINSNILDHYLCNVDKYGAGNSSSNQTACLVMYIYVHNINIIAAPWNFYFDIFGNLKFSAWTFWRWVVSHFGIHSDRKIFWINIILAYSVPRLWISRATLSFRTSISVNLFILNLYCWPT